MFARKLKGDIENVDKISMRVNGEDLILRALREDITSEDITTNAIVKEETMGEVQLICKENGVLSGIQVFARTFQLLDSKTEIFSKYKDGDEIYSGEIIATVQGNMRVLLSGERTALNFLQRMSGIATYTREVVALLEETKTKLLNTRKTTPNMRVFEVSAVKDGSGVSHRYNLSDGILIKDNHINAAGSIKKAVDLVRAYSPFIRKIEVEVENLEMVKEALDAGADIIMLDNMDLELMKKAVTMINGKAITESSGNLTKENIKNIAATGVDYISSGALTHSAPVLDFSMKNLKEISV